MYNWVRFLKDRQENVRDELHLGWPSVVTDNLVLAVDNKIYEDRQFTISTLSLEFQSQFCAKL